jgi:hypothetical protein
MAGNWYNFFPLRPTRDFGLYDGPWGPGRQDLGTGVFFDGGANSSYQDQKRYKPQFYATMSYFKDGWRGSHDFRFGIDGSVTGATCSTISRSTSSTSIGPMCQPSSSCTTRRPHPSTTSSTTRSG